MQKGYKFTKSQENIDLFLYTNDIKILAKNRKEQESFIQTIRIYNKYIGREFGIEKCAVLRMKKGIEK